MNYTQTGIIVTSDPITEFSIQLIATLIGAGVGFALAMWWDRRKKVNGIKLTKTSMIESIISELEHVRDEIKQQKYGVEINTDGLGVAVNLVPTNAFDSSVNSGNFSLLSSELQTNLSHVYIMIEQYNILAEQLLHVLRTANISDPVEFRAVKEIMKDMSKHLKEETSDLVKEIKDVLPELESIKEDLK